MDKQEFVHNLQCLLNVEIEMLEFFQFTMFCGNLKTSKLKLCYDNHRGFFFDDFEIANFDVKSIKDFEVVLSNIRADKESIELVERFTANKSLTGSEDVIDYNFLIATRLGGVSIIPNLYSYPEFENLDIYGIFKSLKEFGDHLGDPSALFIEDFQNDVLNIVVLDENNNMNLLYIHKNHLTYESLKNKNPFVDQWKSENENGRI